MAYTPTTWNTGDTINAAKLNKIEQGIADAGSVLIVTVSTISNVETMDKTYAEIYEALKSGIPCYVKRCNESEEEPFDSKYISINCFEPITQVYKYNDIYRVFTSGADDESISGVGVVGSPIIHVFQASVSTDYPTFFRGVKVSSSNLTTTVTF